MTTAESFESLAKLDSPFLIQLSHLQIPLQPFCYFQSFMHSTCYRLLVSVAWTQLRNTLQEWLTVHSRTSGTFLSFLSF